MSDFDLMISIAKRLNDDRATLLAEVERQRAEIEGLRAQMEERYISMRVRQLEEALDAERQTARWRRAERDTLLLDAREFVRWFNRHYPDPSRDPGHPWCAINNRLNAHADTLETLDAAMGLRDALHHAAEQASKP